MSLTSAKDILKCLCYAALFVGLVAGAELLIGFNSDRVALKRALPGEIAALRSDIGKQVDAKIDPALARVNLELDALAGTTLQAKGLIHDIDREIPAVKDSLTTEMVTLNAKLDTLNASAWELAHPLEPLQPTVDGLNLMFQRNAVPAQTLGLLGASKVAAGEVAQTMKVVRETVTTEAAPTAKAVRESAEGTATTTAATGSLIAHVDDLLFGPKTFKQKLKAFLWAIANLGSHTAAAW